MDNAQKLHLILAVSSLIVGIVVACFVYKFPSRGWVGVILVLIAAFGWMLIEPNDSSHASHLQASMLFLFTAPIASLYSFRAWRRAPDRLTALAAFVGGILICVCFLTIVVGLVFYVYMALSHGD